METYYVKPGPHSEVEEGWYIILNKGGEGAAALNELYAGPYKREKDAKGQLTRLRKGYTPAARKV